TASGAIVARAGANARWRHFVDLIVDAHPTKTLRFLLNADYATEPQLSPDGSSVMTSRWYGANLVVGHAFSPMIGAAVRGEWFRDERGFTTATGRDTVVYDGTLTLGVTPTPNLMLRLDQRADVANEPFF